MIATNCKIEEEGSNKFSGDVLHTAKSPNPPRVPSVFTSNQTRYLKKNLLDESRLKEKRRRPERGHRFMRRVLF